MLGALANCHLYLAVSEGGNKLALFFLTILMATGLPNDFSRAQNWYICRNGYNF
jgi:hypothetical protein